jgi:hypothetical protein
MDKKPNVYEPTTTYTKKLKNDFYSTKLSNATNDKRKHFEITQHLLGNTKNQQLPFNNSEKELSGIFNQFFTNKIKNQMKCQT